MLHSLTLWTAASRRLLDDPYKRLLVICKCAEKDKARGGRLLTSDYSILISLARNRPAWSVSAHSVRATQSNVPCQEPECPRGELRRSTVTNNNWARRKNGAPTSSDKVRTAPSDTGHKCRCIRQRFYNQKRFHSLLRSRDMLEIGSGPIRNELLPPPCYTSTRNKLKTWSTESSG